MGSDKLGQLVKDLEEKYGKISHKEVWSKGMWMAI